MSSSRLTRIQVHERFKQNFNAMCSRQMVGKDEMLDDSLTNLQWLQNLNVNIVNPINSLGIPPISVGSTAGARRVNVGSYRKTSRVGESRYKPRQGEVAQIHGLGSPAKGDTGSLSGDRNVRSLQSRLMGENKPQKSKKKNPLPPLIPQSRTPLPNQYRSRVNGRDSQTSTLPRLSGSNESLKLNTRLCENATILTASPEFSLLSDASPQYVLSPRQPDRDLLPGQVDYKNNPYVKPPFSHFALICMSLRHNRNKKMTMSRIYEWIKNNFIYYRCVGSDWQKSIRDNLVRHKCFEDVSRGHGGGGKGGAWRIDPKYEDKFSDGMLRKRRLASAGEEKTQSSSSSEKSSSRTGSPSIDPNDLLSDYDFLTPEDFADVAEDLLHEGDIPSEDEKPSSENSSAKGSAGHKRKQATPHKLAKRKKSKKQQSKINQLEDQAPELGSLKGDFTWNTIFDEIHLDGSHAGSSANSSLSLTPTPTITRRRMGGTPIISSLALSNEGPLCDVMLPIGMDPSLISHNVHLGHGTTSYSKSKTDRLSSPPNLQISSSSPVHWVKQEKIEIDPLEDFTSFFTGEKQKTSQELGKRRSGTSLHTPTFPDFDLDSNVDLDGFLKDVEALDLTVTGKQIEPPDDWIPVNISLESILRESQDDNRGERELQVDAFDLPDLIDANDENSPRGQSKKRPGRRRPGSASSASGSTNTSPRRVTVVTSNILPKYRQQRSTSHPWQELKTATDTIESLLGTSFDNVA